MKLFFVRSSHHVAYTAGEQRGVVCKKLLQLHTLEKDMKKSVNQSQIVLDSLDIMPSLVSDAGATKLGTLFDTALEETADTRNTTVNLFLAHERLLTEIEHAHSMMEAQNNKEIKDVEQPIEETTKELYALSERSAAALAGTTHTRTPVDFSRRKCSLFARQEHESLTSWRRIFCLPSY